MYWILILVLIILLDLLVEQWKSRAMRVRIRVVFLLALLAGLGLFLEFSHQVEEDASVMMHSYPAYREVTEKETPEYRVEVEALPGMKVVTYTNKTYAKFLLNSATVRYYITPDLRVQKL